MEETPSKGFRRHLPGYSAPTQAGADARDGDGTATVVQPPSRRRKMTAPNLVRSMHRTGRPPRRVLEVAARLQRDQMLFSAPELVQALAGCNTQKECLAELRLLPRHLPNEHGRESLGACKPKRQPDGTWVANRPKLNKRDAFIACGGVEELTHMVSRACLASKHCPADQLAGWIDVMGYCTETLRDLGNSYLIVVEDLATHPTLPDALFRLMHKTQYLNVASSLLEEMLACSTRTYDLKEVWCVAELITGLNDAQLVHFCRILAVLIFDADEGAECNSVMKGIMSEVVHAGGDAHIDGGRSAAPLPKTETARLVSINQDLLASTPGLVARLVGLLRPDGNAALLRQLMRSPEFFAMAMQAAGGGNVGGGGGGGARGEIMVQIDQADLASSPTPPAATVLGSESDRQRWAQMFLSQTDSDMFSDGPEILASVQRMLDHPDAIRIYPQQDPNRNGGSDAGGGTSDGMNLQRVSHSLYMCEVLFVLCTLVGGKNKREIQRTMVEERLAPILCELFDDIVWGGKPGAMGGVHGPDCECCPESALKIQFLRLVRHFCESGDEYSGKRTMLTRNELTELTTLAELHEEPASTCEFFSDGIEAEMYCDGEKGLLSKLAAAFMAKEKNEEFLIFLANSLEGYLRGAPSVDRIFLVERGVLKHVACKILALWETLKMTGRCNQGLLQSLFDLLGELVKFSSSVLSMLDDDLDDKQFEAVMSYTTTNLVASNVFIRSLCLTSQGIYCPAGLPASRFSNFIRLIHNKEKLVSDLIMSVTMKDLDQENICCVSTCIIFFIVANRADKLPELLKALRFRNGTFPGSIVLSNCRGLLSFWRRYYRDSGRSRDCRSLECNSKIQFDEWLSLVDELLLPEEAGHRSIAFWQHSSLHNSAPTSPARRPPALADAGTSADLPSAGAAPGHIAEPTKVSLC